MLIRGLTLPGALNGIHYYLYPDISRLADPQVRFCIMTDAGMMQMIDCCMCFCSFNKMWRCGWTLGVRCCSQMLSAKAAWQAWQATTNTTTTATSKNILFVVLFLNSAWSCETWHITIFSNYRDAIYLSMLNSLTSFFAGFAVFSVLGFMSFELGVDISKVAESGALETS